MAARTKTEAPAPADAEATQAEPGAPVDYSAGQAEIDKMIKFHGHPVGAQLLREVLGWLGRTAGEAARRRPQNRPADLQGKGWEKSSLLALAELCAAYAPEVGTINAPTEPDMFPDATSPAPGDTEAQLAEIAAHRADVVRERAAANGHGTGPCGDPQCDCHVPAVEMLTEQLGAELIPQDTITGYPTAYVVNGETWWHRPDPAAELPASFEYIVPGFHRPDPVPDDDAPANANESRSVIGREQGEPPF
jgi:hypothetical protein